MIGGGPAFQGDQGLLLEITRDILSPPRNSFSVGKLEPIKGVARSARAERGARPAAPRAPRSVRREFGNNNNNNVRLCDPLESLDPETVP